LANKPPNFLETYQRASGRAYGAGLVPLLEHIQQPGGEETLVIESDVVAKYVSQHIRGVNGRGDDLYPHEKEEEEKIELIESFLRNWDRTTDAYYSVLTATSERDVQSRKRSFVQSLEVIDNLLQQQSSDGGLYLIGSKFSYAECIAAPWVQRFYVTMPYFRGIDFQRDILDDNRLERLSNWMREICHRPSCIESKCPEEEMIAACKRYYVSYISPGASGTL